MKTRSVFATLAGLALAISAVASAVTLPGCSGSDKIIIQQAPGGLFGPSNFPGNSVLANNVADDGLAFSNNGHSATAGSLRTFWDVANGTAILLYEAVTSSTGNRVLYATFFDGSKFTPPVQIRGMNENPAAALGGAQVLFLNTSAYTRAAASAAQLKAVRERNGDAIVVFTRGDRASPIPTSEEGANIRLYGTYFDRSMASVALDGTVAYGFETMATAVDYNHVRIGGADQDVSTIGFASDSLHGTHDFNNGQGSDSGDPTSFVFLLWRKAQSDGVTTRGVRFQYAEFDLEQTGNALPVQGGATDDTLGLPASPGTLQALDPAGDDCDAGLVVHNGHAIWRVQNVGGTSEDYVTDSIFSAASGTPTGVLLGSDPTSLATNERHNLPLAANVYGADQGLGSLYAFFTEENFGDDSTLGSRPRDRDLMCAKINNGVTTREIVAIDALQGTIDRTDGDADGWDLRPGDGNRNSGGTNVQEYATRINRTAEFITVLMIQNTTDLEDIDDGNGTVDEVAANEALWTQVVQTDSASRALAGSVLAAALKNAEIDSSGDAGTGNDIWQDDVHSMAFQIELAGGQSYTNSGSATFPDPALAVQSDHLRMNWTYEQLNDDSGAGNIPNLEQLLWNGITVTLGALDTDPPTGVLANATVAAAKVPIPGSANGLDQDWACGYGCNFMPIAVDGGMTEGEANIYFFSNANNAGDDSIPAAFDEWRAYSFIAGGASSGALSTDTAGPEDFNQAVGGSLQAITVPADTDVKRHPSAGGTRHHVFWAERTGAPNGPMALATRSFEKTGAAAGGFLPGTGTPPSLLDNPWEGDVNFFGSPTVLANGSTVGVYFDEDFHLYYNESRTGGDAWSGPTLVDNESWIDVNDTVILRPPTANRLKDSIAAWSKVDPIGGDARILLRVHN